MNCRPSCMNCKSTLCFYNDKLVVMVFGIVRQVFSVVIVDVECVGGTTVGLIWGVVGGGSTGVGGEVYQQVLVEEQVLVDQVVQLKITWP